MFSVLLGLLVRSQDKSLLLVPSLGRLHYTSCSLQYPRFPYVISKRTLITWEIGGILFNVFLRFFVSLFLSQSYTYMRDLRIHSFCFGHGQANMLPIGPAYGYKRKPRIPRCDNGITVLPGSPAVSPG